MAIQLAHPNINGNVLLLADLSLASALAISTTQTSANVKTNHNQSAWLLVAVDSTEDVVVKVSVHNGTPDWTSPTATVTLSDTTPALLRVNTTSGNRQIAVRVVPGTAIGTVLEFGLLCLNSLSVGEDYTAGNSAVESALTGDGSGVLVLTV
jgi:hypothetical protein